MLRSQSSRICSLGIIGVLATWGVLQPAGLAQVTPDSSLGAAGSQVTPSANIGGQPTNLITGGTQRGANLFHSFSDFNVGNLQRVYFANPAGVQNILSRVTGTNPSNILGTLGVNGTANLFFLNPNGILFGSNARLDLRGSFVASTADSLKFDNGFAFSASNPQAPPLLTVNVPIGLQSGSNPGNLQVQGSTLRVNPGQTLALVGGDVTVNGGQLLAPGGRVELAGVTSEGSLDLVANGASLGLRVPASVPRADVSIAGGAVVDTLAGGGGSIAINARNVNIRGARTRVRAGIDSGLGAVGSEAGDVEMNATQTTNIDGSVIGNAVLSGGTGNAGDITITTGSLTFRNGAALTSNTNGQGNAGNVTIDARDTVTFNTGSSTGVFSGVEATGIGDGGNISITTGSLFVLGGAQLVASTDNEGKAGSVIINARDTVNFDGENNNRSPSAAFSNVNGNGIGNGGDITIITGSLRVAGGAQLQTVTRGEGKAGNVIINARDTVTFDGGVRNRRSAAFSAVLETGTGDAGNINITTGSLFVTGGAGLSSSTLNRGDAGNVVVNARDAVVFDGVGRNGFSSVAFSIVGETGIGDGGDINITTRALAVTNGAQLNAGTSNEGKAGNVIINADTVTFGGMGRNGEPSAAVSRVEQRGIGDGGDINITTGSLAVRNGAFLGASTLNRGNAGNVIINARDTVVFDGVGRDGFSSTAFSSVEQRGIGDGGDINITAGSLAVKGGAQLVANSLGQGKAGNVIINARDTVVFDGVGRNGLSSAAGSLVSGTGIGDGGDISITTGSLSVRTGAVLSASTFRVGNGGDITVNANTLEAVNGGQLLTTSFDRGEAGDITLNVTQNVTLAGSAPSGTNSAGRASSASGLFANTSNTSTNRGGDLTINTRQLTVRDGAQVTVSSEGLGGAGTLTVEADAIRLDRQGRISADTTSGGGNINLRSPLLTLRRNSSITTNATGTAKGGNISIAADFIVSPPNENNDIIANAFAGSGGKITLSAQNIFGFNLRTREDLQRLLNTTNPAELDPRRLPTNDITAFSQANPTIDTGAVTVQVLDLDPTRGLTALPTDFTDRSQLIAATCAADKGSSFTITGRGGLPEDPRQPLMGGVIWRDDRGAGETGEIIPSKSADTIVEAQGLMVDRSGTVVLVAGQPRSLPQSWYPTCALQQQ